MELVPAHVHRALRYVEILNRAGILPTRDAVNRFAIAPPPREAKWVVGGLQSIAVAMSDARFGGFKLGDAEPVASYLARVCWVRDDDYERLALTDIGRAVLAGLQNETERHEGAGAPISVVLEPSDPLSYVMYAQAAAEAGAGMLVDSYYKADSVGWLVESTQLTRVLVSSRGSAKNELGPLATALAHIPGADRLVVRASGSEELHDRALIGADGRVILVGTSFNGIGRHLTTITRLNAQDGASIRARLTDLWEAATPIAPTPVVAPAVAPTQQGAT